MMLKFRCLRASQRGFVPFLLSAFALLGAIASTGLPASAAENAKGIYLLGSKASLAGFLPPPGTYVSSLKYLYSGDASGGAADSIDLQNLGNLDVSADVKVDADIFIDIMSAIWVSPEQFLGGSYGVGLVLPVGWQDISVDVNAFANLTLPNGTSLSAGRQLSLGDDTFNFGDPLLTALIGWTEGNWAWNVSGLLNVPIGAYDKDNIANMGFNRWAFDATAAATWLDQTTGREASVAAGFTFNGENADTDYNTGTEFHAEFALMQNFSPAFAAGLAGYYYQQVSGDSGSGASLGDFKGRVTALGPNINYNFQIGQTPVSTSVRWLHEFGAKNRLEGDSVILSATIPLGGPSQ